MSKESSIDVPIYSDGDIEDYIISYLKKNNDKDNEEIVKNCNEGAVFHNFSSSRENLLNWYEFKENSEVLEIGAGMGALTKLLCNRCNKVTAVEMSPKRAEIIKLRCKNNKNLTVLSEDINNLDTNKKFDYITLIGVLEYAGVGSSAENPYIEMLKNASKYLKSDGKILIAIENRFGLKYWCGASEDHTSIPFDGISGYKDGGVTLRYNRDGVRTFDRNQINSFLKEVGLNYSRFYYPLPDYKFPSVIYSDEILPNEEGIKSIKFTYPEESTLIANERELYPNIINNNCFDFFANSFFIEASFKELTGNHTTFASLKRDYDKKYRIITTIYDNKKVRKVSVFSDGEKHLKDSFDNLVRLSQKGIPVIQAKYENHVFEYDFIENKRTDEVFKYYLEKDNMDKLKELIDILRNDNLKSSDVLNSSDNIITDKLKIDNEKIDFGIILKEGYIDLTFVNSFYEDGSVIYFDQEWVFNNVPLDFIMYRAIKTVYDNESYNISIRDLFSYADINLDNIKYFAEFEKIMLKDMMDSVKCSIFDKNMYQDRLLLNEKIDNRIKNKNAHIELLLESERNLSGLVKNKEAHIELLLESERKLNKNIDTLNMEINNLNQKISDLNTQNNNKKAHIELLLESERELERIKSSRSWRYMSYFWKLRDSIIPCGSKRRLLIKMSVKAIKHPIRFAKKCTLKRIGKFFYYLNKEGASSVSLRLDECVVGNLNEKLNLNLLKVDENKVYTIDDFEHLTFKKEDKPKVSIIIPVYNQIHYTYTCLESILKNTENISYEIIIANDCSTDITNEIDKFVENIKVITPKENLRFLRNCNNAAKFANGEYILFLNNDTQVQENWLDSLVELIESDESIGMVGSKLVYPDGRLQEAGGIIWNDASGWNFGRLSDPQSSEYCYVKECDYISGASMMIRHELWNEIGGFDDRFAPAYCEDSDLAFEVRKHGYKVMLQPASIVVHFEGVSNGTDVSSGQKSYQVVNAEKFKEKWKAELEKQYKNGENVFVARDRSGNKKHVLVIDHYVPQYDKDAGSRTVYQYLRLLSNMGYSVSFIGDNFYRHEPYTTKLQQMGIEVLYGPYYASNWKSWINENGKFFDYVLLNRPHISVKYIDYLKEHTKAKIIYYGHDLHFLREMREYELTGEERLLKSSDEWKEKELDLMKKSDVVLYPSEVEVDAIKKINNTLDVRKLPAYIMKNNEDILSIEQRKDLLFVGGFGHGPNVDGIVWFCENILPKVIEKDSSIKLNIVGSKAPDKVLNLKSDNVNVLGFISDEDLAVLYKKCRISIAPLRYGAGIKGKIIEAIANGIPVVTTTCGAEGIENDNEFIIVRDECDEFAQAILDLYNDNATINKNINNGFKFINEHYSAESAEKFIKELFD